MKELSLEEAALAWAQGKRVEAMWPPRDAWGLVTPIGGGGGLWSPEVFARTDCVFKFRLAPGPPAKKWREWEFSEVPVGALTRHKECGGDVLMIIGKFSTGALLAGDKGMYPFIDLAQMREHSIDGGKTWLPCGVEVDA